MDKNVFDNEVEVELENKSYDKILSKLGIKEAKDEFCENTKGKEFLDYCIENNIEISNFDEQMHTKLEPKVVLYLIANMDSFEKVVNVLNDTHAREQSVFDYRTVAKWYNIYDPKKLRWFADGYELLLDEEYLENASVEWTQDYLFNFNMWFYYKDGQYVLKDNPKERGDFDYFNPFYDNVYTLRMEKENGRLKQAIDFLIDSTLRK